MPLLQISPESALYFSQAMTVAANIVKKEIIGRDSTPYTKESIAEVAPKEGVLYIICGVCCILMSLAMDYQLLPGFTYYICAGVTAVALGLDIYLVKKKLVKKNLFNRS